MLQLIASLFLASTLLYGAAPTDILLSNVTIVEHNSINDPVGTLSAVDADSGDTHTFSFSCSSENATRHEYQYSIDGNTLRAAAVFDLDMLVSSDICIKVTDSGGASFEKVITVPIGNLYEPATIVALNNVSIFNDTPVTLPLLASNPDATALTFGAVLGDASLAVQEVSQQRQLGTTLEIDGAASIYYPYLHMSLSRDGKRMAVYYNNANGWSVRVYEYNGNSWEQIGSTMDFTPVDWFCSVSLSADGTTLAVGNTTGRVARVYRWHENAWQQMGEGLGAYSDTYNGAVSLSSDGTIVALGSRDASSELGTTRMYRWSGYKWQQMGSTIVGAQSFERSGAGVSLSSDGMTVAITAPLNDAYLETTGIVAVGVARVYRYNGSDWQKLGEDMQITLPDDYVYEEPQIMTNLPSYNGISLSGDGTTVGIVTEATYGINTTKKYSTFARIFTWNGSAWVQKGSGVLSRSHGMGNQGLSLNETGNLLALGSVSMNSQLTYDILDTHPGTVDVHYWDGSTWQRSARFEGDAQEGAFGATVTFSGDGSTVAVGSHTKLHAYRLPALTLTPDSENSGSTTVTLSVNDGTNENNTTFTYTTEARVDSDHDGTPDIYDRWPQDVRFAADSDNDGVPDEWESLEYGNLTTATVQEFTAYIEESGFSSGDAVGYDRGYDEGNTSGYTTGYSAGTTETIDYCHDSPELCGIKPKAVVIPLF